jgi:hypothetical protein
MPDDGALVSSVGVADLLTNEVRGDRARGCGTTDIDGGTTGSADPLFEGPSRALPSARSSSPSTGTEAGLDAWEVDPPPTISCRDRTLGRWARVVAVSYCDSASSSSSSSPSPSSSEAVSEGGFLLKETLDPLLATVLYQCLKL